MKQKALYEILLGATILLTLSAIITLTPATASHTNGLGYYSLCSWAPWSSLICLGLAGTMCIIRARLYKRKASTTTASAIIDH